MSSANDAHNAVPSNSEIEEELAEEMEEINVESTADGLVWVYGEGWELFLSPDEAKTLGEALIETAKDAEEGME